MRQRETAVPTATVGIQPRTIVTRASQPLMFRSGRKNARLRPTRRDMPVPERWPIFPRKATVLPPEPRPGPPPATPPSILRPFPRQSGPWPISWSHADAHPQERPDARGRLHRLPGSAFACPGHCPHRGRHDSRALGKLGCPGLKLVEREALHGSPGRAIVRWRMTPLSVAACLSRRAIMREGGRNREQLLRLADDTSPGRYRRGSSGSKVTNPMAGKPWMKTRPGQIAFAALAWTLLGCVFALPDLSGERRSAPILCFFLSHYGGILGNRHPDYSLDGSAPAHFPEATCPPNPGAHPAQPGW